MEGSPEQVWPKEMARLHWPKTCENSTLLLLELLIYMPCPRPIATADVCGRHIFICSFPKSQIFALGIF